MESDKHYQEQGSDWHLLLTQLETAKKNNAIREELLSQYLPFIVKVVSDVTGRYVHIGDSDELSIGLMAFDEAIDRYEADKGVFMPYAKLVISSRVMTFMDKARRQPPWDPLEKAENLPSATSEHSVLAEEIDLWQKELKRFNISLQKLVKHKPIHKDTRERAYFIAETSSQSKLIVNRLYDKLKLPVQLIHRHLGVSVKVLEGSKIFITAVIIIFVKELGALKRWIKG